ncbi:MAG TPA: DUF1573 domain-containing protein [Candidatus Hypogeohydataceae bacterium YC41]
MKKGTFISRYYVYYTVLFCIGYYGTEGLCNTTAVGADINGVPRLSVPESSHSFGQIYRGEKVQHRFLLKNIGDGELEIRKVRASCGCTAAEPSRKIVPPGGEAYIEATFNSHNFVGKVTKTVMVDTNDPAEPTYTLTLEALILEEVVADPSRLILGQIRQGEGKNINVVVKSPTGLDLKVLSAQSSSKALQVASTEKEADGVYAVKLEVKKDSPIGRFSGDLVVQTNSQRQPTITVPFYGEVVSDIAVFPLQLSFGLVKKGTEAVRLVLVTFYNQEVKLAKVEVESEVFSLRENSQSEGGFCRLDIVLNKEAPAGRLSGNLKIYTTSKSQPLITIPLSATVKE